MRVVNDRGRPVAGARVYISNGDVYGPPHVLTTDEHGAFETSIPHSASGVQCLVVAKGYAIGGDTLEQGAGYPIKLTRPQRIYGKVVDKRGRPIAGARVHVDDVSFNTFGTVDLDRPGLPVRFTATTDAQGVYTMQGVPHNAVIEVDLDSDRYVDSSGSTAYDGDVVAPIVTQCGTSISGRVLWANGKPAAEVPLTIYYDFGSSDGWLARCGTGDDGIFGLNDVPPGRYEVAVDTPENVREGKEPVQWQAPSDAQGTAALGRPLHFHDIRLLPWTK